MLVHLMEELQSRFILRRGELHAVFAHLRANGNFLADNGTDYLRMVDSPLTLNYATRNIYWLFILESGKDLSKHLCSMNRIYCQYAFFSERRAIDLGGVYGWQFLCPEKI